MDSGRCVTKKQTYDYMRNEFHKLPFEQKAPFEAQQLALKNDHERWLRSEQRLTSDQLRQKPLPAMAFSVLSFSNNSQTTLKQLSLDIISRFIRSGGTLQTGLRPEYMISQQVCLACET
jgi:hypothetical protein